MCEGSVQFCTGLDLELSLHCTAACKYILVRKPVTVSLRLGTVADQSYQKLAFQVCYSLKHEIRDPGRGPVEGTAGSHAGVAIQSDPHVSACPVPVYVTV